MMKKITVSAPGKLMLLGEHAVVYDHPCLVTAVNQRMKVTVEILAVPQLQLEAPDVHVYEYKKSMKDIGTGDIPKGAKFVEVAVKNLFQQKKILRFTQNDTGYFGLHITTSSEFSSQFGFGSSSASTVCVVKALSELFEIKLTNKEIFDIAYKTVLDIQGKGSGFDVAAALYGGTLYFMTGGKVIKPLTLSDLPLVVGYSGVKADTVILVNQVKEKFANNPKRLEEIYMEIEQLVEHARGAMDKKDWEQVGKYMNKNQMLLQELGVSIPKLDNMIDGAVKAGAFGAKLSGAGGGDCMIALVSEKTKQDVSKAISSAGGEVIPVTAHAEGARIE